MTRVIPPNSYMTCVRLNTGWKYCLIGVLGGMGLAILKVRSPFPCTNAAACDLLNASSVHSLLYY